ncbi:cupin-like domain-containing protein [Teredinibacter turnerae]|uniref:cupin-like domain-containing protein n=1 Tax=Teredinibacter turnerae TaxID=2426 RepID=UPI0003716227|nr:cupin-like domain-containing protein [Teredinibacter turnerae]
MANVQNIEYRETLTEREFIEEYVKPNRPVVVKDTTFKAECWSPEALAELAGDLEVQVYDTLFALQEVSTLKKYLDENFGHTEFRDQVRYVRWYNQLKAIDHAWGDEAFDRVKDLWSKPEFLPATDLLVPASQSGYVDPVTDGFPYRGILIAAKGARTRLHTDPFCSDAVVAQFYGVKDFVMYSPDRAEELRDTVPDSTSFGGFIDVRPNALEKCKPEPDFHGVVGPGNVAYVPHGWLHDVLVLEDSVSITWNFIHEMGSLEFIDYLMEDPHADPELEVLKYFYSRAGENYSSPSEIVKKYSERFAQIEDALTA